MKNLVEFQYRLLGGREYCASVIGSGESKASVLVVANMNEFIEDRVVCSLELFSLYPPNFKSRLKINYERIIR